MLTDLFPLLGIFLRGPCNVAPATNILTAEPYTHSDPFPERTSHREQGYYCAPEHERLASAAAAAALAALSQGSAAACKAILAEDDSVTLLAYPLAVGCASVAAVKQETEAVLQVRPATRARPQAGCHVGVHVHHLTP